MKRLLLAVAALCAFAAFAAASVGAASSTLSVTVTPSAPTTADQLNISATGTPAASIELYADAGVTCEEAATIEEEPLAVAAFTDGSHSFSETLAAGTYAVNVWTVDSSGDYVADDCKIVTVVTAPSDQLVSSYLCWNHDMVNPVAYIDKTADTMWKTGNYIEPQAILGNVVGGTNIGAYHLVCNAPSTMRPTGFGLGGSGEVYAPDAMAQYHQDHAGGNDLNLYHIWK